MLNRLIINGTPSDEFGVYLTDAGVFETPEPEYETIEIEGRNGDLIIDKNRFKNIKGTYPAVIYEDFERNYMGLRSFLLSKKGYLRLEDTFVPERFRLGRVMGDLTPKYPKDFQIGSFEINFWCKPQWFLKTGEQPIMLRNNGKIFNPTMFEAKPLIRVYGAGNLGVGGETVTIKAGAQSYVDIDCDIMDCYEGVTNRNGLVTMTNWPTLTAGANNIAIGAGITRVVITPRWYVI